SKEADSLISSIPDDAPPSYYTTASTSAQAEVSSHFFSPDPPPQGPSRDPMDTEMLLLARSAERERAAAERARMAEDRARELELALALRMSAARERAAEERALLAERRAREFEEMMGKPEGCFATLPKMDTMERMAEERARELDLLLKRQREGMGIGDGAMSVGELERLAAEVEARLRALDVGLQRNGTVTSNASGRSGGSRREREVAQGVFEEDRASMSSATAAAPSFRPIRQVEARTKAGHALPPPPPPPFATRVAVARSREAWDGSSDAASSSGGAEEIGPLPSPGRPSPTPMMSRPQTFSGTPPTPSEMSLFGKAADTISGRKRGDRRSFMTWSGPQRSTATSIAESSSSSRKFKWWWNKEEVDEESAS
ncbi:hypothetical protein HK101_010436, partial [Irineochytrium annulatum]